MGTVRFYLVKRKIYDTVKESHKLSDIWNFIKKEIKDPENYLIDEFTGNNFTDCMGAEYLIENYETEKDVPQTISEIPDCSDIIE